MHHKINLNYSIVVTRQVFLGMCFATLVSVLTKIFSKTILFKQMSLNLMTTTLSKHFHNFLGELVGFEYLL